MSKLLFLSFILLLSHISKSQIRALTENGRQVILFENGTWQYDGDSVNNPGDKTDSISTNSHSFSKSTAETFLVKSNIVNVGVYLNPSKWTFTSHKDNEKNPEYRFSMKAAEGYAIMITEKTPIELENMREIALINARKASIDIKETAAEFRMVNNKRVLSLKFEGTVQGIKFAYFGYYYSNNNGTVQLLTYTSQQFSGELQKELELFLDGFVELSE
jgi:hypothetical protein